MNIFDKLLSYLILLYIVILPIFPSKFKIMKVPINGDGVLALILVFYLASIVLKKEVRQRFIIGIKNGYKDLVLLFGILLFAVMMISVTYSLDKSLSLNETIRFGTFLALYFIIKLEVRDKTIKNILVGIMSVAVVVSIIGLVGIPLNHGIEKQVTSTGAFIRIESTFENSNNFGAFLILMIFPFITLALNMKSKRSKLLYSVCSLLLLGSILLTKSRNSLIAFIFGCACYVIIYNWKSIVFFVIGFGGLLFVPSVRDRLLQVNDVSQNLSRIKLWKVAISMIKAHPILGVGNGNYASNYGKYEGKFTEYTYKTYGQFHPHNIILKMQSELGIMGLLMFCSFIFSIFMKFFKVVKNTKDKSLTAIYKGFSVSFLAFMMMNLLDNFFSAPKVIAFFWIVIALAEATASNNNSLEK